MLKPYCVTFAGHRELDDFESIEAKLTELIEALLRQTEFVEFNIGNDGEFDIMAASVIRRVRKNSQSCCTLNLVLPYPKAGMHDMEASFDSVFVPDELRAAHPKRAITLRNRWMLERCDLLICCVNREQGGAAASLAYAKKMGIKVYNIAST